MPDDVSNGGAPAGPGGSALPLARRPDFALGAARVRPSLRSVEGPGGNATVEPRVMHVLLALVDAQGAVLSRDDLMRICWEGVIVGDDSVNRAIGEIRRAARATEAGFAVETIARVGYRLTVDGADTTAAEPSPAAGPDQAMERPPVFTRRRLIGAGIVAAAAAGGGLWLARRDGPGPRFAELVEQGRQDLRQGLPDSNRQGVGFFREAVALDPGSAKAWGLLALALRMAAENAPPEETSAAVRESERAAQRALALDPREGNALAALATLQPFFGQWLRAEDSLREVLRVAPDNFAALNELVILLQSVGRNRESWQLNERAVALDPLSPVPVFRRALKHWIFARIGEADRTIDGAFQLWPRHPAVWNARLLIFAFTGRASAALAMIEDEQARPPDLTPRAIELWHQSLAALDSPTGANLATAREANLEAARSSPGFAVNAVMVLSHLGELDAAFAVADGFLLRRGPVTGTLFTGAGQLAVTDMRWRRTPWLFIPATAAFRADPRFGPLCEGIGLADYWRRRGIGPDFLPELDRR